MAGDIRLWALSQALARRFHEGFREISGLNEPMTNSVNLNGGTASHALSQPVKLVRSLLVIEDWDLAIPAVFASSLKRIGFSASSSALREGNC